MNQVFVRSENLVDKIYDVKLRLSEWRVLFAVNGEMSTQELADLLDVSVNEVETILDKLAEMELISPIAIEKPEKEPEAATPSTAEELTEETAEEMEMVGELKEEAGEAIEGEAAEAEKPELEFPGNEQEELSEAEAKVSEPEGPEEEEKAQKQLLEETIEGMGEQEEESEEDLDQIIGELIRSEQSEEASTTEPDMKFEETTTEPEVEAEQEEESGEIDLGSIFEEELQGTEEGLEKIMETMEVEEETEAKEAVIEETPAPPTAPERTILVVDDSVVIRKMVEIALENENYKIVALPTGKEALKYLDDHQPDLVILDIMLPDVNGLDILKAIKASKQIPVVMLSAKDTPRETTKAKELGADDFIPKPFKDEELVSKIKELIGE